MTWTLKNTVAAERRVNKLVEEGVNVDMESHAFRSQLGYCYLEVESFIEEDEEE
jgi:hypothetical protein